MNLNIPRSPLPTDGPDRLPDNAVAIASRALACSVALLLAFAAGACNDPADPSPARDAALDVSSSPDVVACSDPKPADGCVSGTSGGCCDDAVSGDYACKAGVWVCPQGRVPFDSCCGYGVSCRPYPGPPKLACAAFFGDAGADGPSKDTADAPDAEDAGGGCTGTAPQYGCSSGSVGGCCDDVAVPYQCVDGQWRCRPGTVPTSSCCGFGNGCRPYPGMSAPQCPAHPDGGDFG